MRHGRKSQHQRFDGYKLSAAATNTTEPLITAIDVAPAGEQDGPQAKHLVDAQPAERRPRRVLGDTAYATGASGTGARTSTSRPASSARTGPVA